MTPGQVVTLSEGSGFDTITERWYYGTAADIPKAGGNTPPTGVNDGAWIYIGPSDVERLPGGAAIVTLTWRGLLASNDGEAVTETRGIRESTYDSIAGIPSSGGTVQGRILDQTVGLSVRVVSKTANKYKPTINTSGASAVQLPNPAWYGGTPPKVAGVITDATTWTYPYGWICYSWQQEEPIKGFYLVTAEFRYEHQKLFG